MFRRLHSESLNFASKMALVSLRLRIETYSGTLGNSITCTSEQCSVLCQFGKNTLFLTRITCKEKGDGLNQTFFMSDLR